MVAVVREVEYQHGPEEVFFSDWKKQQPFLVNWKIVYLGLFDEEMMQIGAEQSEHASLCQNRYELLFVFSRRIDTNKQSTVYITYLSLSLSLSLSH